MVCYSHPDRHKVALFVRDGLLPIELGIAHRLFGQARSLDGQPLYEVVTCTLAPGPVRTDIDVTIDVVNGPDALREADTVVIPASDDDYEPLDRVMNPDLAAALNRIQPTARIASICTGSFVLAAAGLLDGLCATTHWRSVEQFRELYPKVRLDPDVLYTDEGRILTSAGVASGIDLCLHMIRSDYGSAVANEVARGTVVSPHREGGQAQFIARPVPEIQASSTGKAREWALEHLDQPLTVAELAEIESVSIRTFTRRFRQEVGTSPLQWLNEQRVERARALLEETDLTIDHVAARSGFGTAASMRQHLHAVLSVSPSAYRATFRGN